METTHHTIENQAFDKKGMIFGQDCFTHGLRVFYSENQQPCDYVFQIYFTRVVRCLYSETMH